MSIFNRHKLQRQWGRGVLKRSEKNLHDFAWHKRKNNPLWQEEEGSWRLRIEIIALAIGVLTTLLIVIYHPFFFIKKIEISGLQRISRADIEDTIRATINYRRWLLFPGQDYFVVNLDEVVNVVKQKFPIQSIKVIKKFPDAISVSLEEKITNVIYDDGLYYSYVGIEGKVLTVLRKVGSDEFTNQKIATEVLTSSTVSSTLNTTTTIDNVKLAVHTPPTKSLIVEMGDYPVVFDKRQTVNSINNQVLRPETVKGIIDWFNSLKKFTDVPFGYITVSNDLGEGELITGEGWFIKIRLDKQVQEQFAELQYLLKNKIKRPNLKYIDLRYLGKVYWQ